VGSCERCHDGHEEKRGGSKEMFERRILRGLMLAMGLALVVALLLPSLALADKGGPQGGVDPAAVGHVTISGNPLTIHIATDTSIQVDYAGKPDGQVSPPFEDEADSGGLMWGGAPVIPIFVYGPDWANHDTSAANLVNPWIPLGQSAVSGSGTAADPWQVTTTVGDAPQPTRRVVQWVRYVDGNNCFRVLYTVNNLQSDAPDPFTFFHAVDMWPDDTDDGYGFYDTATGAVGAWNGDMTFLEYLVPVTVDLGFPMPPASHYQEAYYSDIWDRIGSMAGPGPGFNDTIRTDWKDTGAGLQWDLTFPGVPPEGNFVEFVFDWCFLEEEPPEEFVPEPGSVLLLASGLMGLAGYAGLRRWKR
jgi:hypothetical protein